MSNMEYHEAANIFPLDEENLDNLAADIREHGQFVPIETLDGKILDGRRRYLACGRVGVQPKFREVETDDPVAYVISLNLHRRHLTPSQAAMCAARAIEYYKPGAAKRMQAGRPKKGSENLRYHNNGSGKSADQAGRAFNVGGRTVEKAKEVLEKAVPEVVKAVDQGRMSVSAAAELADEPEEVQREKATDSQRYRSSKQNGQTHTGNGEPERQPDPDNNPEDRKVRGKGVALAHEAINCLSRIPKNDALRKRGFQIVTDWIRRNR